MQGRMAQTLNLNSDRAKLLIAKDLVDEICTRDVSFIDSKKRNPKWVRAILNSYSRNICTLADTKTILQDVYNSTGMSDTTLYDYLEALEKLFIVEDVDAWCPSIRSKSAIRASSKRNFVDPSIAAASLGVGPDYFDRDYKTFGFLFESLCIRDLKVYASKSYGSLSYYRDRYQLEADAVLHLDDGRYALIEFKLGQKEIEKGASNLLEIERLIIEKNKEEKQCPLRLPDLKLVITGGEYGYRRDDGVFVIPIGALRD